MAGLDDATACFGRCLSPAPQRIIPALTLWQPWASLIAGGAKRFEKRGRPPPHRLVGQRIAIHAAARMPRWSDLDEETHDAMCEALGPGHRLAIPLGVIVCTAVLTEALPAARVPHDLFGDYSPGRWAWRLEDVRRIDPLIPAKGMQLWGWPWRVPDGVIVRYWVPRTRKAGAHTGPFRRHRDPWISRGSRGRHSRSERCRLAADPHRTSPIVPGPTHS